MNYKLPILLTLSTIAFLLTTGKVYAAGDTNCQPVYGGGQICEQGEITINKTVKNPSTGSYVDNLNLQDPKFKADQDVSYQVTVTNTGKATISKTTVKDIFPQFVTFLGGSGDYDVKNNTLSFDIVDLKAGESRTFTLSSKVKKESELPNQNITCVVNQAIATTDTGKQAQDNSQICIEKKVVTEEQITTKGGQKVFPPQKVVTTPSTGPEMLALAGLIPSAVVGFILRKKTSLSK